MGTSRLALKKPGEERAYTFLRNASQKYRIGSVVWKHHVKRLCIEPGNRWLTVPLSACVTVGDEIRLHGQDASVICKNGESRFLPPYFALEPLKLGSLNLQVAIKEITEREEHDAYNSLAEFHYRGNVVFGRTARLIVRTFHPSFPDVIGYIELATPFYMNKARATVLNSSFASDSVQWQQWDIESLRKYIHVIVRISRTVVYPEFRGLGIGQVLIRHAARFAKRRWQVSRYLPLYLEISADMLKYVPFAERAGMVFVGETEGNLHRVEKDMRYLMRRFGQHRTGQSEFEETCGICDQQVARKDHALKVMKEEGMSKKTLLQKLRRLSGREVLKDFALFHGIVTLPKPHYMLGLRRTASTFLRKRVRELKIENGRIPPTIKLRPLEAPIRLKNLSISYTSRVRRTSITHAVQQAFGISPDDLRSDVIRDLSMVIEPGAIVLVVGPSGSGKTSLLRAIAKGGRYLHNVEVFGTITVPESTTIGGFRPIRSQQALIEVLGKNDVRYGLYLLSLAGLSEAFLYLKRFSELSAGQQYRAMIASLIARGKNVWLADEFCTNLDAVTANVVGHNVQSIARKLGATVVTAAPHFMNFVFSLRPDLVIYLTSAWEHRVVSGKEFCRTLSKGTRWNGSPPTLSLLPEYIKEVQKGNKKTTIRIGRKWFEPGLLVLRSDSETNLVRVTHTIHKSLGEITEEDARRDGFSDLSTLKAALLSLYPRLTQKSVMTIVHFEPICG